MHIGIKKDIRDRVIFESPRGRCPCTQTLKDPGRHNLCFSWCQYQNFLAASTWPFWTPGKKKRKERKEKEQKRKERKKGSKKERKKPVPKKKHMVSKNNVAIGLEVSRAYYTAKPKKKNKSNPKGQQVNLEEMQLQKSFVDCKTNGFVVSAKKVICKRQF